MKGTSLSTQISASVFLPARTTLWQVTWWWQRFRIYFNLVIAKSILGLHTAMLQGGHTQPPKCDMPSDQSTWLIAVPQDGDAEGLLHELTGKLPQHSRSAELAIPSFKVFLSYSWGRVLHLMNRPVDWDIRLLDCLVRRAAKARRIFYRDSRQDCGYPSQFIEQRSG